MMVFVWLCVLQQRRFFDGLLKHQTLYYCGLEKIICIGALFSCAIVATVKDVRREGKRRIAYSIYCV